MYLKFSNTLFMKVASILLRYRRDPDYSGSETKHRK